jgi:hypothetical protein
MVEMALEQHRSRHAVDVLPPLLAFDPALEESPFGGLRRKALVHQLDGQAGLVPDRRGEPPRGRGLWTVGGVEAQRQPYDDPHNLVTARDVRQPPGQAFFGLGRHRGKRLGDGFCRVAQGEADTLRPGIDRKDPHWPLYPRYGDGFGVGDGVGVAVDGGATPCSTT